MGKRRVVLIVIVSVVAICLSKAMTSPTASVSLAVRVIPFTGLIVELYDESGQLVEKTDPDLPPLEVALTTPDRQSIRLSIPETSLEGLTIIRIYLNATLPRRVIIDQADNEGRTRGIMPIPGTQAIEFTANRDLATSVTISLPYPRSLEGAILNNLGIFRLDGPNPRWILLPGGDIDPAKCLISAEAHGFSTYRVMAMAANHLRDVIVYPNPFIPREAHGGCLKFIHLTPEATIRIYNMAGDLVWSKEIHNSGGAAQWYGNNDSGRPVASGIYVYVITNPNGEEVSGKISVIR